MKALMNIGNDLTKKALEPTVNAIERIFDSGFKNRMDQSTIVAALNNLAQIVEVKQITVTNSVFKGGHKIYITDDDVEKGLGASDRANGLSVETAVGPAIDPGSHFAEDDDNDDEGEDDD